MEGPGSTVPRLLHSACNFSARGPLTFRRATWNRRAGRWTKTSLSKATKPKGGAVRLRLFLIAKESRAPAPFPAALARGGAVISLISYLMWRNQRPPAVGISLCKINVATGGAACEDQLIPAVCAAVFQGGERMIDSSATTGIFEYSIP